VCGQLGLEPTPGLYCQHIVAVCREVKRVLRDDGSFWLNLGDSYAGGGGASGHTALTENLGRKTEGYGAIATGGRTPAGLKPKDLVGIPWTVAFALRDDGWYLRRDIIWEKPNPMPESCRDRPTSAHEYVFLLTKSGTAQYWVHRDHNGTRERPEPDYRWRDEGTGGEVDREPPDVKTAKLANGELRWKRFNLWRGHDYFYDQDAVREPHKENSIERCRYETNKFGAQPDDDMARLGKGKKGGNPGTMVDLNPAGRNARSVWNIPTKPYPEAHFATFPPELARRCILTSPTKVCKECGAGWERVVERLDEGSYNRRKDGGAFKQNSQIIGRSNEQAPQGSGISHDLDSPEYKTLGFRPTCDCDAGVDKAIILDPFMGSGTVALVAHENFRHYVGLEINPDYIPLADKRGLKQEVIF